MLINHKPEQYRLIKLLFLFTILFMIISCSKDKNIYNANKPADQLPLIRGAKKMILFSEDEKNYIRQLKERGKLVVATRIKVSIYYAHPDGKIDGFHYHMIKSFADFLDINLEIKLTTFDDYFSINGRIPEKVKTDQNYSYTPDLIKNVDIIVDGLTHVAWRKKLLKFIRMIPVKQMLVTRKGEELNNLKELSGKTISMKPAIAYEVRIKEIEKELGVRFKYLIVNSTLDMPKVVATGKADVTIQDSDLCLKMLLQYPNLNVNMPISEVQYTGWAVHKENKLLASILDKFIVYAQSSGLMDKYWRKEYGISMIEYLSVLDLY